MKVEWLVGSDKALAEVGTKATQRNVLVRTLTKAAAPIQAAAEALAPDDPSTPPIDLHTSIIVGPNSKLTPRQKRTAYKAGKLGVAEVHVGTSQPQGMYKEFGTIKMPASPWFRPAWDAHKGQALTIVSTELWAEISKAAARAARKRAKALL